MCLGSHSKTDEQKLHSLEAEVLELRTALKDMKHRNLLLEEQLEQSRCVRAFSLKTSTCVTAHSVTNCLI